MRSANAFQPPMPSGDAPPEPADLDPPSSHSTAAATPQPSAGTKAARNAFLWLLQVAEDPDLPPLGYRLAIIISQKVDRRKGYAHPPHSELMKATGASRRGIQITVKALEQRGHLGVVVGRGSGHANRYRLKLDPGRSR